MIFAILLSFISFAQFPGLDREFERSFQIENNKFHILQENTLTIADHNKRPIYKSRNKILRELTTFHLKKIDKKWILVLLYINNCFFQESSRIEVKYLEFDHGEFLLKKESNYKNWFPPNVKMRKFVGLNFFQSNLYISYVVSDLEKNYLKVLPLKDYHKIIYKKSSSKEISENFLNSILGTVNFNDQIGLLLAKGRNTQVLLEYKNINNLSFKIHKNFKSFQKTSFGQSVFKFGTKEKCDSTGVVGVGNH